MMPWGWLFDLEVKLLKLEDPAFDDARRQPWRMLRKPVSRLTRRLERRGRMV
jgi:hypothetical protein